jgi:eukaryotic-like serine/threonine-protein kinase
MQPTQELNILTKAIEENLLDGDELAKQMNQWQPARYASFLEHLQANGTLKRKDVTRLLLETPPSPEQLSPEEMQRSTAELVQARSTQKSNSANSVPTTDVPAKLFQSMDATPAVTAKPAPSTIAKPILPAERYHIIEHHAKGGLGHVWRVEDKLVGRKIALKSLRADRANNLTAQQRFIREAQITAQLEHPGVVPVLDYFQPTPGHAGGDSYSMRFVAGRTLADAIAKYHANKKEGVEAPLEFAGLIDAVISVCRTMSFAHSKDVLHRDLKGQNILLGEFGEVFVVDWGLGKHLEEVDAMLETQDFISDDEDKVFHTGVGTIVGTPAFMAPELARGAKATKQTDVYALGVILYTLLTGKMPVVGAEPKEILENLLAKEPVKPSEIAPGISATLEAICLTAMAREPKDRYASVEELAFDLRKFQADEPVSCYREPLKIRASRWAKRHRTGVIAAGIFGTCSILGLGAYAYTENKSKLAINVQKEKAQENYDRARTIAIEGAEVVQASRVNLTGNPTLIKRLNSFLRGAAPYYLEIIRDSNPDTEMRGRAAIIFNSTAISYRTTCEDQKSLEFFDAAIREYDTLIEQSSTPMLRFQKARCLTEKAILLINLGKLTAAKQLLQEVTKIRDELKSSDIPKSNLDSVSAYLANHLAAIEQSMGNLEVANDLYQQAEKLFGTMDKAKDRMQLGVELALQMTAKSRRVKLFQELGEKEECTKLFNEVREMLNELVGLNGGMIDNAIMISRVKVDMAMVRYKFDPDKQIDSAEKSISSAIKTWQNLVKDFPGEINPQAGLANALLERGKLLTLQKKFAEAKADLNEALFLSKTLSDRYPQHVNFQWMLVRATFANALYCKETNDFTEAAIRLSASKLQNDLQMKSPENVEFRKNLSDR